MNSLVETPLETVDRAVRRAFVESRPFVDASADETTRSAAALERHRAFAGKQAYDSIVARVTLPHDTPLRDGLARWVGALAVARVTGEQRCLEAAAIEEPAGSVKLERATPTSFRGARMGLLRAGGRGEATAWLAALAGRGHAVAAARRERLLRQAEAVQKLGFPSMPALVGGASPEVLDAGALRFLRATDDLAASLRKEVERRDAAPADVLSFVLRARALDCPEGWPARLTTRTLVETLRAPDDLGHGLRVDLSVPEVVGAASFARALQAFGAAYRRAVAVASRVPFALAVDPYFIDAFRYGFAFGSLASSEAYHRVGLGVVARVAKQQARRLAETALAEARRVAVASLLDRHGLRPDLGLFDELTESVFGGGVPRSLAGAFPRALPDEPARLEALLTGLALVRELRDRFDEDWFRNPKAWFFLRARASGPAREPGEPAPLDPLGLARAFEEALG
jgi:hypothetical protein